MTNHNKTTEAQEQRPVKMRVVRPVFGLGKVPGKQGRRRVEMEPDTIASIQLFDHPTHGAIGLEGVNALIEAGLARVRYE